LPKTGIQDLNSLIPANSGIILLEAHAINDRGQILAYGAHQQNGPPDTQNNSCDVMEQNHVRGVFLLTPTQPVQVAQRRGGTRATK
jgi:hypothetical protein